MRTFLGGRFENSVFVLLSPTGQDWLSRANRGPHQVFGGSSVAQMQRVALRYPAKADLSEALVQDFHTFRQALNVASADQRVLVLVHAPKHREPELRKSLRGVANDPRIVGRFHFDFECDDVWRASIANAKPDHGVVLIHPGEFGLKGRRLAQLPLEIDHKTLIKALLDANQRFARTTPKKVYSQHVQKGRQQGIYFEGAVPYGEDRDGDGQIDRRGPPRR